MSNSYTKAAFSILMSPADVTTLCAATKAVDLVGDDSPDEDLKLSFDALGVGFHAAFPAKGPNHFGSFLELFDDPAHPGFGCDVEIEEPGKDGLCAVTFSGEQVEIEAVARLIFTACKSALPCGFEWMHGMDRLRTGEFGGGCVVITAAGIQYHGTRDILDRAITRELRDADEAVDGLVMTLRDAEHGLRFWDGVSSFGSLTAAKVYSPDEAHRLTGQRRSWQLAWLAMPAPLAR